LSKIGIFNPCNNNIFMLLKEYVLDSVHVKKHLNAWTRHTFQGSVYFEDGYTEVSSGLN
jgi:hypothetical protein